MIFPFWKCSIEKLKILPRRKRGIIKFGNYSIEYPDPLSLYFEYKDIFENRIYHFNCDKPSPMIIDAGGYIGMSLLYFKSIYPQACITVFEPDTDIFLLLKNNIKKNKLQNIKVVNAGLGKINGAKKFYPDGIDGGSIFNISNVKSKASKIKIIRLSEYINEPIDFLKMNIEGAEGDVFEEIEDKLHFVKEIVFEYHAFYNLPQNLGKILNILGKEGFRYLITDATSAKIPVPFNLPKRYRYFNLVYAKQV